MPFDSTPKPIVPRHITCGQHGDACRVEAQRILEMTDGRRALFAFATCGRRTLRPHEFGELIRPAE